MDDAENEDIGEARQLRLIDVSSEDDCLIESSLPQQDQSSDNPEEQRSLKFLEVVDVNRTESIDDPEPERARKTGKCNLRKSLAWDNAFFTSAGVLDPEELTTMIGVGKARGKPSLPGIQEDLRQSADSISTLESDDLSLESIEADLFVDIRASIQKSRSNDSENSSAHSISGGTKAQLPSKKVEVASAQVNAKPALKKSSCSTQGSGKMIKQSSLSTQSTQPTSKIKVSTSSAPKPPKVAGRGNPISVAHTKRESTSGNHTEVEKGNAVGRGASLSKIPRISAAGKGDQGLKMPNPGTAPQRRLSSRLSSVGSIAKTKDSSIGSSTNMHKSVMNLQNKRNDPKPSTSSVSKAPARAARHKSQHDSNLSAYVKSIPKPSASTSPASSVSEWSCESSSSASTTMASHDSLSPYRGPHANNDASQDQDMAKEARSGLAKPSGLRMPSPKIGFFDGVKPAAHTPKRDGQSHCGIQTGLPKIAAGLSSTAVGMSRRKSGKVQTLRAAMAIQNVRNGSQGSGAVNLKSVSLKHVNENPPPPSEDQNDHSLESAEECHLKNKNSPGRSETAKCTLETDLNAEGNEGSFENKTETLKATLRNDTSVDISSEDQNDHSLEFVETDLNAEGNEGSFENKTETKMMATPRNDTSVDISSEDHNDHSREFVDECHLETKNGPGGDETAKCALETDSTAEGKDNEGSLENKTEMTTSTSRNNASVDVSSEEHNDRSLEFAEECPLETQNCPGGSETAKCALETDSTAEVKDNEGGLENKTETTTSTPRNNASVDVSSEDHNDHSLEFAEECHLETQNCPGGSETAKCALETDSTAEGKDNEGSLESKIETTTSTPRNNASVDVSSEDHNDHSLEFAEECHLETQNCPGGSETARCALETDLTAEGKGNEDSPPSTQRDFASSEDQSDHSLEFAEECHLKGSETARCILDTDLNAEGKDNEGSFENKTLAKITQDSKIDLQPASLTLVEDARRASMQLFNAPASAESSSSSSEVQKGLSAEVSSWAEAAETSGDVLFSDLDAEKGCVISLKTIEDQNNQVFGLSKVEEGCQMKPKSSIWAEEAETFGVVLDSDLNTEKDREISLMNIEEQNDPVDGLSIVAEGRLMKSKDSGRAEEAETSGDVLFSDLDAEKKGCAIGLKTIEDQNEVFGLSKVEEECQMKPKSSIRTEKAESFGVVLDSDLNAEKGREMSLMNIAEGRLMKSKDSGRAEEAETFGDVLDSNFEEQNDEVNGFSKVKFENQKEIAKDSLLQSEPLPCDLEEDGSVNLVSELASLTLSPTGLESTEAAIRIPWSEPFYIPENVDALKSPCPTEPSPCDQDDGSLNLLSKMASLTLSTSLESTPVAARVPLSVKNCFGDGNEPLDVPTMEVGGKPSHALITSSEKENI